MVGRSWQMTHCRMRVSVLHRVWSFPVCCVSLCYVSVLSVNSNPLPASASVDMDRQYRTLDAVQKRGAWSQAKSMHRYEHSSRLAADYGKLPPEVRTLYEECEKFLRQIMLGARHPVHRTRQELMLLREAVSCRQRAKLRAIRWNPSGH